MENYYNNVSKIKKQKKGNKNMSRCNCPNCYRSNQEKTPLTDSVKKMLGMIPHTQKKEDNLPLAKTA